jgi:hypothetical protein
MKLLLEVGKELLGMFVADGLLTAATLALVGVTACLQLAGMPAMACGGVLLLGALLIVATTVIRAARS